jgi:hypothetical protein
VHVKTYKDAVRIARSAGEDAANRRMRKAGRKAWSLSDQEHAASTTEKFLTDLGFDIAGWISMAGVKRNEPQVPGPKKRTRSGGTKKRAPKPVQLAFAFA